MTAIRIDRWRALGILLLALLALYGTLIHWSWTAPQLQLRQQLIELREQELRLRMHAAQTPAITQRLAEVEAFEANNPGFLPETSTELATAGLVQRLERVVEQASPSADSCQLTGRTPTSSRSKERFTRVTIQVRLRCGMGELAAVLNALESGSPELFVDRLAILSRRKLATSAAPDLALDVSFDLYGYLRLINEAKP
ncbi:MAG: general secretion pathway protein GspM [Gammaproteobacteria bacterium HGW-Gammaproteobacteria-4]|jgi:general secretion pathway protein M|nr:MAG: general secretion pathway protein GspM [Gammaproteobacteria bacterium HGW-Gammaproteobacteria-4]